MKYYKFLVKFNDNEQKYFIVTSSMDCIDKEFIERTKDVPMRFIICGYYPIFLSDAWKEVVNMANNELDNDCKKQDVSSIYFIN